MKIGNIVSNNDLDVSEDFNVVKSMDEIIHGLPTLIVGFDYVNKHYPDFDITENKLETDLYWTFKKTERRDDFNQGLSLFVNKVYKDLFNQTTYLFVDPIQYTNKNLLKIIKKIYKLKTIITYVHGNMVYIYGEKIVFGVDLKLLTYMGLNIRKIKTKIKDLSSVLLTERDIFIEYKKSVEDLEENLRYIPYLYSIKNEKNDTISNIHIPRESRVVS